MSVGAGDFTGATETVEPGLPQLRVVATTESTNDDAMELARAGAVHGAAVASHEQTGGRGRRGHVWRSPEGGLYLSVVLRPSVPMQYFMGLPAVCALGALDAIRAAGAGCAALKWPNDLVLLGGCPGAAAVGKASAGPANASTAAGVGKLAGILVEAGSSDLGPFAVCGIGVNLVRPNGPAGADSAFDGSELTRPLPPAYLGDVLSPASMPAFDELAGALREGIVSRVDAWSDEVRAGHAVAGPLAPVLSEYFDRVPLLGHQVEAIAPDGRLVCRGVFCGVDVWGRATVHAENGEDIELASEQASLRAV